MSKATSSAHGSSGKTGELDVTVESLAPGGEGVIRLPDGRVGFVHGVLAGERVRVAVDRAAGKKLQARLLAVLEPSADRVDPPCLHARRCGGCDWMHIAREAQASRHAEIVAGLVKRAVGAHPEIVAHTLSVDASLRSRARFALRCDHGVAKIGYRARGSHTLVDVDACLVLEAGLLEAARLVASWLGGDRRARGEGEIGVAFGMRDGKRLPVVELTYDGEPPGSFFASADRACSSEGPLAGVRVALRGARQPITVGDPHPVATGFDGEPLVIATAGFAQPSDAGGTLLAERTRALASPDGAKVLELYAGSGTLSIGLCRGASSFASVEENADAVACARKNLTSRGLSGTLRVGDAESASIPRGLDVVVLDPPRAGAPRASAAIAAAKPKRIVYVSCDPPTLARDLAVMSKAGYGVSALETVELFSYTSHVETIALLTRGAAPSP
ncbi:MAG: class I SAM-dependent RNA methyltransferase [Polyangiaceae bacterium]|nr:class I SAM-dependent RNA methyltransferase [Polyangiaceae bacterium]